MPQINNDIVNAAVRDLLKIADPNAQKAEGTGLQDTEANLEKKKKNAQAQTGENAVLSGGIGAAFGASAAALLNRAGNQY